MRLIRYIYFGNVVISKLRGEVLFMRKTKIICTLGPSTDENGVLEKLICGGMNVARFNFSHSEYDVHKRRFCAVEELRERYSLPIATMMDTRGPEIRVGMMGSYGNITELKKEDMISFIPEAVYKKGEYTVSDEACHVLPVTYERLCEDVTCGTHILIDDGLLECEVTDINGKEVKCRMLNEGILRSRKGINIPGCELNIPFISKIDEEDIRFGAELGFDFIAASFVRRAQDILDLRKLLDELGSQMKIIAKIENLEGIQNIEEILDISDGIMVARGDMGVEIPGEDVPVIQKRIIKNAYREGKHVITATQMLESMIEHNRPTRAEVNDIANAIYDGTSAIMLSGETAAGRYPVEALQTMAKIAVRTEQDIDYKKRFNNRGMEKSTIPVTDAISHAACMTAHDLNAEAIIAVTLTGRTAINISKFRPLCPVIGCATTKKVCYQMNLAWGVTPLLIDKEYSAETLIDTAATVVKEAGYLSETGMAVVTAGVPIGKAGKTNMMRVVSGIDY